MQFGFQTAIADAAGFCHEGPLHRGKPCPHLCPGQTGCPGQGESVCQLVEPFAHFQAAVVHHIDGPLRAAMVQGCDTGPGQIVGMDVVGMAVFIGHWQRGALAQPFKG